MPPGKLVGPTLGLAGSLARLQDRPTWTRTLAELRRTEWVVYAKRPFADPQQVLDYVGRYTHRVAITNHRLLDIDGGQVRFTCKGYRAAPSDSSKTMTLAATECIRRFLLHVLPTGFHRIRYYGFLALAIAERSWPGADDSSAHGRLRRPSAQRPTIVTGWNRSPATPCASAPPVIRGR